MKKVLKHSMIIMFAAFLFVGNVNASPTTAIDLGDPGVENVQSGRLAQWFEQEGLTNTDGSAIDPVADQVQYELFYTDMAREYQVDFLGIGGAGYHSPFGVFTYSSDPVQGFDPAYMTYYDPLFVQNEVEANTSYSFTVEAGSYFGFYLDSNGTGKMLNTMVSSNLDGLDHALFFNTNKGYTIAFEDIVWGGDRDYEDLIVNFAPTDGSGFTSGQPTPEPATMFLLGMGLIGLAGLRKKMSK